MFFIDNFEFNQNTANTNVLWAFLNYVKKVFLENDNDKKIIISSAPLVEAGLNSLNLKNFDFINNASIKIVENALINAMEFLATNSLVSSDISKNNKFYKFFIKKELFNTREFNNDFEQDLVLSLIYKLSFSLKYLVDENYLEFYKTYYVHSVVESATVLVDVKLPFRKKYDILVLPKYVSEKYLLLAMEKYDYTHNADYVGNYNKLKDTIKIFATNKNREDQKLSQRLLVALNVQSSLKKQYRASVKK